MKRQTPNVVEMIHLTPAELADIVAAAVAHALAQRRAPLSPAEKQRAYRQRRRVTTPVTLTGESVTAPVTPEGESVTTPVTHKGESVTTPVTLEGESVTTPVTLEGESVTTPVTLNVTPSPSPSPPPPPSPRPPSSPAPTPTLSPACMREGPPGEFALDIREKPKRIAFAPPTLDEWTAYALTLSPPYDPADAENAWNFYVAKGWKVGNQPMKDWQAACRTCHGRWKMDRGQRQPSRAANGASHGSAVNLEEYR